MYSLSIYVFDWYFSFADGVLVVGEAGGVTSKCLHSNLTFPPAACFSEILPRWELFSSSYDSKFLPILRLLLLKRSAAQQRRHRSFHIRSILSAKLLYCFFLWVLVCWSKITSNLGILYSSSALSAPLVSSPSIASANSVLVTYLCMTS